MRSTGGFVLASCQDCGLSPRVSIGYARAEDLEQAIPTGSHRPVTSVSIVE